jgi:hypothetical protein
MLQRLLGGRPEADRQQVRWQKCVCLIWLMFLFCRAGCPRQKPDLCSVRLEVRSAAMTTLVPVTFCGRTFTTQEVELMRVVAHDYAGLGVTEIARTVCELLEWKRPNGGLKNHECRQLLERLQAAGVVTLPALRKLGGKGPRRVDISQQSFEAEPVECAARECEPLEFSGGRSGREPVVARARGTLSLPGMPGAVRGELALLGAESPAGTRLPAVDIARLEDEAPGCLDRLE